MKNLYAALFLLLGISLHAQEYDKTWFIGREYPHHLGTILSFEDSGRTIRRRSLRIEVQFGGVTMNNRDGQPQFYTNGTAIASAIDHRIMENSWDLSIGSDAYDYERSGIQILASKTYLTYPDEKNDSIYYLVYSYSILDKEYLEISDHIQLAKIDMRQNNGKGKVVYKNRNIYDYPTVNKLDLVRHANGRDWWLILRDLDGLNFTTLQLNGDSIISEVKSAIPDMGLQLEDYRDSTSYNGLRTVFTSPNGEKMVDCYGKFYRRIFQFNRCKGEITLRDTFRVVSDVFESRPTPYIFSPVEFSFSPNNRYLYAWSPNGFFQWDTEADDIEASAIRLGGPTFSIEYDGNVTNGLWAPSVGQIGPDGRIYYILAYNNFVINNPDERCPDCGFCYAPDFPINSCMDGLDIEYSSTPFYPNYRLGPIDGSVCDTLGIDNIPRAHFRYDVKAEDFPRPVVFRDLTAYEPTVWFWDFGDGSTSTIQHPIHEYPVAGIYTVCLTASNVNASDTKCIDLDLRTSSTVQPDTSATTALVFPNPTQGYLQISLPDTVGQLSFTMYDVQGKEMNHQTEILPGYVFRLPSLAAGMYFYNIQNKEGKRWTGKVVVE